MNYAVLNNLVDSTKKVIFTLLNGDDTSEMDLVGITNTVTDIMTKVTGIRSMIDTDTSMSLEEKEDLLVFIKEQITPFMLNPGGCVSDIYTIRSMVDRLFARTVRDCNRTSNFPDWNK